jgi:hypothetical protein
MGGNYGLCILPFLIETADLCHPAAPGSHQVLTPRNPPAQTADDVPIPPWRTATQTRLLATALRFHNQDAFDKQNPGQIVKSAANSVISPTDISRYLGSS